MRKSFSVVTDDVSQAMATLRKSIPETMKGFGNMAQSALAAGALSPLEKELIDCFGPALPSSRKIPLSVGAFRPDRFLDDHSPRWNKSCCRAV